MNKRTTGLSRAQQERLGLVAPDEQPPVQVISLTPAQYRRIEDQFPINTRLDTPEAVGIQLGQQAVLAFIRKALVQGF